jgi:hypothetical protein
MRAIAVSVGASHAAGAARHTIRISKRDAKPNCKATDDAAESQVTGSRSADPGDWLMSGL